MTASSGQPASPVDTFNRLLQSRSRPPEWRDTANWIIEAIEAQLGAGWFASGLASSDSDYRCRIFDLSFRRSSFVELLEFALRLSTMRTAPGFAKLRSALAGDRRSALLVHSMLTLDAAAIGQATGFTARFEVSEPGFASPVDLVLRRGDLQIPVEAKAILLDQEFRRSDRACEPLSHTVLDTYARKNVALQLELDRIPLDVEETRQELERLVELALARQAPAALRTGGINAVAYPPPTSEQPRFTGPTVEGDMWPRIAELLREKARKPYSNRPVWVRVDMLNGLWMFTSWATLSLADKVRAFDAACRTSLRGEHIAGVIATSGACPTTAEPDDETALTHNGAAGVRRHLDGWRARETIIVPLNPLFSPEAEAFVTMAHAEPGLLGQTISRWGLPPLATCFAADGGAS